MSEVGEGATSTLEIPPETKLPPIEKIPPFQEKQEKPEKPEDQVFLEQSHAFGDYYVSLIGSLAGKSEPDKAALERLPLDLRAQAEMMGTSVRRQFIEQALRFTDKKMDARALLGQVYKGEQFDTLLADPTKYRLEQLNYGLYAVHVDIDLLNQLRKGTQAVAIMPNDPEGISFLMIRDAAQGAAVGNLDENIPHETEHIAWKFIQRDGLVTPTENDPLLAQGFMTYQNEFLARLSSDGAVAGYNFLDQPPPAKREELQREHPEAAKALTERTFRLNDMMETFREELRGSTVGKSDLILGTIQSRSFDDLEANLTRMRGIVTQHPKPTSESVPTPIDWTSV